MINIKQLFRSFKFAWRGLTEVFRREQNFRIHLAITVVVMLFGFYFQIKIWQWTLLILLIGLVLILEMMNTVFERLVDMYKPRLHEYVRDIKDIMSASVLVISLVSLLIGVLIFWPYFFN